MPQLGFDRSCTCKTKVTIFFRNDLSSFWDDKSHFTSLFQKQLQVYSYNIIAGIYNLICVNAYFNGRMVGDQIEHIKYGNETTFDFACKIIYIHQVVLKKDCSIVSQTRSWSFSVRPKYKGIDILFL